MSKIICDVCGTSYPETADQCPICGCVRPAEMQGVISDHDNSETKSGYTYVKGGRFSKANVRKRVKANPVATYSEHEDSDFEDQSSSSSNKGLVITALVLLVAIIAVIIYITVRFFGPSGQEPVPEQTTTENTVQSVVECTGLTVTDQVISLPEEGSAWMLNVQKEPADTTQEVTYTSADETVATVSDKGKVTAVGVGETVITISCGSQSIECRVVCDFEVPTEENTEETTEATVSDAYTEEDIIFNSRYNPPEATLRSEGETWNCYKGNIPVEEITWKSDDESVATVKDGIVTAVGSGKTEIHAIWGDIDVTCTVRCNFITTPTGIPGSDDVGEG